MSRNVYKSLDKGGEPYTNHLERVARSVLVHGDGPIGWLHDILEDTHVTKQQLDKLFDPFTVEAVLILTHTPDEAYTDYIDRVCKSHNVSALRVKKADLEDNMDPHRSATLHHLHLKRYERAYAKISAQLELTLQNEQNARA